MPDIANFTRAIPIVDNPNVYIDGAEIEDIKKPGGFIQTVEYTEMYQKNFNQTFYLHNIV